MEVSCDDVFFGTDSGSGQFAESGTTICNGVTPCSVGMA